MSIQFYNPLKKDLELFKPQNDKEVRMYTCGPTVYNFAHIGNLRTFLFEDLLHRWLEYRGYRVHHIRNLTDVDDKTIRNSQEKGMSLESYTDIYKKAFFEDLKMLNIVPAEKYPEATAHIEEMIELIETLMEKGYAYETEDGVYFDVQKFDDYGKLVNLDREKLQSGASGRVTSDEYEKENISDFALWKKYTPEDGDVVWDAPFGKGRPGWHSECVAMSTKYLGNTLDIHSGGIDLAFPHHTNEIAQAEAATGETFVNYWLHAVHLMVEGEKMSKSKGNFFTLRDLLEKGYEARSIRFLLYTTHYRKPLNFTFDGLKAADSALKRLDEFLLMLKNVKKEGIKNTELSAVLKKSMEKFEASLDEDLNIAEAMGAIFELVKVFNEKQSEITGALANETLEIFQKLNRVLGFLNFEKDEELSPEILALIEERAAARAAKDWAKSDEIRDKLAALGIEVRDGKDGIVIKRI